MRGASGKGVPAVDEAIASVRARRRIADRRRPGRGARNFPAPAYQLRGGGTRAINSSPSARPRALPVARRISSRAAWRPIGVIGGGTMGSGIAVSFLDAGFPVTLMERDEAALAAGLERIRGLYDRSLKSGRIDQRRARQASSNT